MDIGHAIRAGADPAAVVKEYKNRIFDLHIKDEEVWLPKMVRLSKWAVVLLTSPLW